MQFGVQAMDRLLKLSLMLTALVLAGNADAQDAALYTVAGDVPEAETIPFDPVSHVYVLDLVEHSGLAAPEGNALILRGNPLQAVFSDNLRPQMMGRGSRLMPGDVVVFRSLTSEPMGANNLVMVTDGVPQVIPLNADDTVLLRDVTYQFPEHLYDFSVTQTTFGSAREVAKAPNDRLLHGDVIQVRSRTSSNEPRISSVSHSSNSYGFPDSAGSLTGSTETVPAKTASFNSESALTIPAYSNDIQAESSNNGLELPAVGELLPAGSAVASSAPPTENKDPFQQVSFPGDAGDDSFVILDSAGQTVREANTGAALWNGVFILGLVFALGLIAVGWVKTQNERKAEQELAAKARATKLANSKIRKQDAPVTRRSETPLPPPQKRHAEVASSVVSNASESKNTPQEYLVLGDEESPILSTGGAEISKSQDDPVLSKSEDLVIAQLLSATAVQFSEVPEMTDSESQSVQPAKALVNEHEWFGGEWLKSETATIPGPIIVEGNREIVAEAADLPEVAAQVDEVDSIAVAADIAETELQLPPSECWSDLNDLLQNRLTMQLMQADLPLKITLFGKPTGPQRLRIDSAHTQIAPPHMSMGARSSKRAQPVAAPAKSVTPAEESIASRRTSIDSGASDANRFDRALNFLEEQADT